MSIFFFFSMNLEHNIDGCLDLVEKCKAVKHERNDAGWKNICKMLQDAYIRAVNDDDNKRVVRIYELWSVVDPVPAGNVHRMYAEFAREYWRCNLDEAQKVLKKYGNYSDKYLVPLTNKLNIAKSRMLSSLELDIQRARSAVEIKAILSKMEQNGASKERIKQLEDEAKKRKFNRSGAHSDSRENLFRAITNGSLWLAGMSVDKGAGRRSRDGQKRYINGVSSSRYTAWDWLIYKIRSSGNSDYYYRMGESKRQALIGILLLLVDKEHLTAEEQREIEQIKEIADFVLK